MRECILEKKCTVEYQKKENAIEYKDGINGYRKKNGVAIT